MRFLFRSLFTLLIAFSLLTGCTQTSPLVGVWSGTPTLSQTKGMLGMAGAMLGMNGPCTLTLKADGTGFLKVPLAPERAIAWTEEDGKVILRPRDEDKAPATSASAPANGSTVGTLSADKQRLDLDLGIVKIAFKKQSDAK